MRSSRMRGANRSIGRLAAMLALGAALLFGQSSSDKLATVEGTVTNGLTGDPVPRAHVTLVCISEREQKVFGAITKADGTYSMPGLPAGRFNAEVKRAGFFSEEDGTGTQPQIVVGPGETKSMELKLLPTGAIRGRVVDPEGEPVENANVSAEGRSNQYTMTDDKGEFRLGGLAAGKYRIQANVPDSPMPAEIRTDGTTESHFAQTFYPGTTEKSGAARVQVAAGAEMSGIEIRLIRTPIVRIKGKVLDMPAGVKMANVQVIQGHGSTGGGPVKADGSFEIWRLNPGKYELAAVWNDPKGSWTVQTTVAEVEVTDSNIDGVELRYVPPVDISGTVQFDDEQAKPPQPKPQQANPPAWMNSARVSLQARQGTMGGQDAEVAADGSFTLKQVRPGKYHVRVSWSPVYVKSMRLGDLQIDGNTLDLSRGVAGSALTVLLSSATGQVTGTVTDDNGPVAKARIALVSGDSDWGTQMTVSGPDGTYGFNNLAPGTYKVVIAGGEGGFIQGNMDMMEGGETVEIGAGEKVTKDLKK